jgi:hypothetical protein
MLHSTHLIASSLEKIGDLRNDTDRIIGNLQQIDEMFKQPVGKHPITDEPEPDFAFRASGN